LQLQSIQALRGLAAILVMLSHLYGIETRYSEPEQILSSAWLLGVSGVDLFFVISGFIMVWVTHETAPGVRASVDFVLARVMRIYPVWWLFAGLMAAYFALAYGVPWDPETLQRFDLSGPEHLIKSFLLIPHEAFPILQIGWTLMHEVYFYLVFAILLFLPIQARVPAAIVWALIIVAAASVSFTGFYADSLAALALSPLTLEFLMGVGVGVLIKNGASRFALIALGIGIIWLVLGAQWISFQSTDSSLPLRRTLAFGPAFALIVYAVVVLEARTRLKSFVPTPLVRLGDWSYSLYLGHLLVLSGVARLFFPMFGGPGLFDNAAFLILSSSIAIALAALVYYAFERPLAKATRKLRSNIYQPVSPHT